MIYRIHRRKLVWVVAGTILGLGGVTLGATQLGKLAAEKDHARLDADLGITVMVLPQADRALIALLALECDLANKPQGRQETLQCLRSAAAYAPRVIQHVPNAPDRLESILSTRVVGS